MCPLTPKGSTPLTEETHIRTRTRETSHSMGCRLQKPTEKLGRKKAAKERVINCSIFLMWDRI